jgi:hypothetical protein
MISDDPIAKSIEPWKGQIARADHQHARDRERRSSLAI